MNAMPEIFVNDVPQKLESSAETWGELLDTLDARAAADGVILSAARFDGVDEPAFRAPAVTSRELRGLNRVDIETARAAEFLRACLVEAVRPLPDVARNAQTLAECYRRHDLARGHAGLAGLAAELRSLAMLLGTLRGPLGIDLAAPTGDGGTIDQRIADLGSALDALVAAQSSEDWVTVADTLEYDIEPAIQRSATVLTSVAESLP
jgi:hypothetical protein